MSGIVAVWPKPYSTAFQVHLYAPGFKPGSKARSVSETSLCGVTVNESTPPPVGPRPTGRKHVPLEDAALYVGTTLPVPTWIDPPKSPYRWCGKCVGLAVEHLDLMDHVMELISAANAANPEEETHG